MYPPDHPLILVVEDNPATAALQQRRLERAGYQVITAPSAEEALAIIRGRPVDLALLDHRLGGELSGLDFVTSLRTLAPDLPVIMVSGSGSRNTVIQALRGGVRDFIRKDVHYLDYLPNTIAAVLQRARLETQLRGDTAQTRLPVLIVDDDEAAAVLQRRQLERAAYEVLVAQTPPDALRIIETNEIGLLVLDQRLADSTGLELLARIKAAGHDVPTILVSAYADEDLVIEALRAGVRDFVPKTEGYQAELQAAVQRVSERARLEAQLFESKARLAGIVGSAMDAIILIDSQLRITLFNQAAERTFEVSAANALGQTVTRFLPDLGNRISSGAGLGPDAPVRYETRGIRGAAEFELEVAASTLDLGGRSFFSVIVRDLTERKHLERLLLQRDKLESLGILAGGIAHDFNNLLVGIMGNASMALETISTNSPARAMLRDVVAASEAASNLTRQLLAYAGKGRFIIEPVDLSGLVRQIATLVQASVPKSVQLRLELMENAPSVEADIAQMQQLLMNLVINAAEATAGKQGAVLITTGVQDVDEHYIESALAPAEIAPGRYVLLQVHDNGIGMTQETIDKIFDPFFSTKFTGRGLGLAAVLGIVRGHRGAIKIYSTPGQGTTFKVLLPATGQKAHRPAPVRAVEVEDAAETILVVDDEQIVRRTARAMLERFGYRVVLAENGKEAVDLYRALAERIQLVILDMTMPVMGGEEAFREMKTINPAVRVILSSGYNEVEAVARFTGKGLGGFIQKPYNAASLAEKVRGILERAP